MTENKTNAHEQKVHETASQEQQTSYHYPQGQKPVNEPHSMGSRLLIILGVVLIILGALTLLPQVLGPLWAPIAAMIGFAMRLFWPILLIIIGFFIIRLASTSSSRESGSNMGFTPSMPPAGTRLMRSRNNRMVAGVCGGIAEYFSIDPSIVRIITVIIFLLPGISWLIYILAWIIIPQASE